MTGEIQKVSKEQFIDALDQCVDDRETEFLADLYNKHLTNKHLKELIQPALLKVDFSKKVEKKEPNMHNYLPSIGTTHYDEDQALLYTAKLSLESLKKEDLNNKTKKTILNDLLYKIEVFGRWGRFSVLKELLLEKGMPKVIQKAIVKVFGKFGAVFVLKELLLEKGLGEDIKLKITSALLVAAKPKSVVENPKDIINSYIKQITDARKIIDPHKGLRQKAHDLDKQKLRKPVKV